MKKLISLTVATFLLSAGMASAAAIPATTVFNGQTQAWGNAGQSITATFRVNVAAGEVVHAIRTKVDSQATVCTPIGPFEGAQDVDVSVNVILPPNSNVSGYNLTGDLFTTATLPQAEAMTGNLACTGTNTTAYNGTNVLHVLPTSGGSVTPTPAGGGTDITQLIALIAELQKQIAELKNPATPAPTAACAQLATYGSFSYGDRGEGVRTAQNFVMQHGGSISAGATGFWGNQSAAALIQAKGANHCA